MTTRTVDVASALFCGDRRTELAVIHVLLTRGTKPEPADVLLAQLCDRDFCWADTAFAFCELQRMASAKIRLEDAQDIEQWLRRKESLRRFTESGCNWLDAAGKPDPARMLMCLADEGNPHELTAAEIIMDLRRWRKTRALRMLGHELIRMVDSQPSEPHLVAAWLDEQLDKIADIKQEVPQ